MSEPTKYLIDANVLIQAKRHHYRFNICPGFWDALVHFHHQGLLYSIDKVRDEILDGDKGDDVRRWVIEEAPRKFFRKTGNADVEHAFSRTMAWVGAQERYKEHAIAKYAASPDARLVAYATLHADEYFVVTHEQERPESKAVVQIPDVCRAMDVKCIPPFDMLSKFDVLFESSYGE